MTIKAPYNFVPLESEAFYPEWANHISQDIPFEDGVSGSIEYTLTAETPIFVRNGQAKNANDNTFSHTADGRYFIPGTSIKGEIRSVLEILSFGKMTQVQDARFGIRDLSTSQDGKAYRQSLSNVSCGWLYKEDGKYHILDCETPGRINPSKLFTKHFDWNILRQKIEPTRDDINEDEITKSALCKYIKLGISLNDLINKDFSTIDILNSTFTETEIPRRSQHDKRQLFIKDPQSKKRGTIILTGQPKNKKKYDFIFFPHSNTQPLDVLDDVVIDFMSIHKNNIDFKLIWHPRLENNKRIPVFFTKNNNGVVNAIGLSSMFRIPSTTFIKGAIPAYLQSNLHKDMAECIFGTSKEACGSLRGRVYFGHAFAKNKPQQSSEIPAILCSPKPSFGPLYTNNGTWNSTATLIKGRKRYPVLEEYQESKDDLKRKERCEMTENANIQTRFSPLPIGTEFSGTVYFHNLRECELGALIAALTFNGKEKECFHSIGEAKPFGYGKVKIQLGKESIYAVNTEMESEVSSSSAMESFQTLMRGRIQDWDDRNSLKQLFKMAEGIPKGSEENFTYMTMDIKKEHNQDKKKDEFSIAKKNNENLPLFTTIIQPKQQLNQTIPMSVQSATTRNELDIRISKFDDIKKNELDENERRIINEYTIEQDRLAKVNAIDKEIKKLKGFIFNSKLKEASRIIKDNYDSANERQKEQLNKYDIQIKDKLNSILNDALLLKTDGEESYRQERFEEADEKLRRAIELFEMFIRECSDDNQLIIAKSYISICNTLISDIRKNLSIGGMCLKEYFCSIKIFSPAAFATPIKQWMKASGTKCLSDTQIVDLGQILNDKIPNTTKENKKKWGKREEWKTIEKVLGKAPTDLIYSIVIEATK